MSLRWDWTPMTARCRRRCSPRSTFYLGGLAGALCQSLGGGLNRVARGAVFSNEVAGLIQGQGEFRCDVGEFVRLGSRDFAAIRLADFALVVAHGSSPCGR